MKVYTKKEDRGTIIPGVIITIVLLSFPIGMAIINNQSEKSFIDILVSLVTAFPLNLIFLMGLCLLFAFIKKPKYYKAKLISKKTETYNGKQITYMDFGTRKKKEQEEDLISSHYKCFTVGGNNLVVGNDYLLGIKESSWRPVFVEEANNSLKIKKVKAKEEVPNSSYSPVFLFVGIMFGGLLLFCAMCAIMYPQYAFSYYLCGLFCAAALFVTIKGYKTHKADNYIDQKDERLDSKLKKIKPLKDTQKKVGNVAIKHLLVLLIIFPAVWAIVLLAVNISMAAFWGIFQVVVIFTELIIIAMIIYYIGYDKRLIDKFGISISESVKIPNTKHFNILRATSGTIFPQYFVVNQNKDLLLKIKKSNFIGNKYVICDHHDIRVGEIKLETFNIVNEFIVNIKKESPFIVRSKVQIRSNYQITGRDCYVKGDAQCVKNILFDKNNNVIAYISATSKKGSDSYEMGNTEVVLDGDIDNSIDIIVITSCVTIGNFQTISRRINV